MHVKSIAVVGAGLMGRGIAYASAAGGFRTALFDVSESAVEKAFAQIQKDFDEGVSRGKLMADEARAARERLVPFTDLKAAAADADFVIEAVPERLDLKIRIFAELDEACPEPVVLATNTSALSVGEIAAATRRPSRVVGMHFFNPVPKMKLVEIVKALETSEEAVSVTTEVARRMGKETVRVK